MSSLCHPFEPSHTASSAQSAAQPNQAGPRAKGLGFLPRCHPERNRRWSEEPALSLSKGSAVPIVQYRREAPLNQNERKGPLSGGPTQEAGKDFRFGCGMRASPSTKWMVLRGWNQLLESSLCAYLMRVSRALKGCYESQLFFPQWDDHPARAAPSSSRKEAMYRSSAARPVSVMR